LPAPPRPPPSSLLPYTTLFRSHRIARHPLPERETGRNRPLGIVAVRLWQPEQSHDGVPGELLDRAAMAFDLLARQVEVTAHQQPDRKSTRLNSSHGSISYAVFC